MKIERGSAAPASTFSAFRSRQRVRYLEAASTDTPANNKPGCQLRAESIPKTPAAKGRSFLKHQSEINPNRIIGVFGCTPPQLASPNKSTAIIIAAAISATRRLLKKSSATRKVKP